MASFSFTPSVNGQSWDIDFLMAQADALIASAEFLRAISEQEENEIRFTGKIGVSVGEFLGRQQGKHGSCEDELSQRNERTGNLMTAATSAAVHSTLSESATSGEEDRNFRITNCQIDVVPKTRQWFHLPEPTTSQQSDSLPLAPNPATAFSTRVTISESDKGSEADASSNDIRTDSAKADEFYRAGSFALEQGQAANSLALFRQALAMCPPSKRTAVSKIEKQIDLAQKSLSSATLRPASSPENAISAPIRLAIHRLDIQTAPSRDLAQTSFLQTLHNTVHTDAAGSKPSQSNLSPSNEHLVSDSDSDVSAGSQVIKIGIRGKAEAADSAYRAGIEALEKGKYLAGISFLRQAASLCPAARKSASAKIQKLIREAEMQCKE